MKPFMILMFALYLLPFTFLIYAGNTGAFNDPNIIYIGTDPMTGEFAAVKGCRPERVLLDGSCDRSFRLAEFLLHN